MESKALLAYFLPEGILEYFDVTDVRETSERLTLVLEEKPLAENEMSGRKLRSKGFHPNAGIQDFPIRRKSCYLEVRRRRWVDIDTGEAFSRDWELVAKGTRMTTEFALFLKGLVGQYPGKL